MVQFMNLSTKKNGTASLYVRVQWCGLCTKINTGVAVDVKAWGKTKAAHHSFRINPKNADTDKKLRKIEAALEALRKDGVGDLEAIKRAIRLIVDEERIEAEKKRKEAAQKSIWHYYQTTFTKMAEGKDEKQYTESTLKIYKGFGKLLFEFLGKREGKGNESAVLFDNITKTFASDFIAFLRTDKSYMAKTINKNICCFRALCKRAYMEEVSENERSLHVWSDTQVKEVNKKTEVYLTDEEIDAAYNLFLPHGDIREVVRDLFFIGYKTGQRFSDYNDFNKSNFEIDGHRVKLHLVQKKTQEKRVIPILDSARVLRIMEKWNYNIPHVSPQQINRYLKEVFALVAQTTPSLNEKFVTLVSVRELSREKRFKELSKRVASGKKLTNDERNEYRKDLKAAQAHGLNDGQLFERNEKGEVVKFKWELVGSHTARRSTVTNLVTDGLLNDREIMVISGHTTEKSFKVYNRRTADQKADSIFDKIEGTKTKAKTISLAM